MHLWGESEERPVCRPQSVVPSLSSVPSGLHFLGRTPFCLPVSHPDLLGRVEVPTSLQSAHSGPQGAMREMLPILQTEKLRREEVKALAQSPDGSGSARTPATCAGFPGPQPFSTAHQKTLRGVCIKVHSLQLPPHQAPPAQRSSLRVAGRLTPQEVPSGRSSAPSTEGLALGGGRTPGFAQRRWLLLLTQSCQVQPPLWGFEAQAGEIWASLPQLPSFSPTSSWASVSTPAHLSCPSPWA